MSQSRNCVLVEREPGKWYYILEQTHAPKNSYDWRMHADATGPFESEEQAMQHLHLNHSNPGGYFSYPYDQWQQHGEDETYKGLLDGASAPENGLNNILFGV